MEGINKLVPNNIFLKLKYKGIVFFDNIIPSRKYKKYDINVAIAAPIIPNLLIKNKFKITFDKAEIVAIKEIVENFFS